MRTFLCPLEHDSIEKMLTTCVVSKTVTPEVQAIAVISTALREYFFYGKDVFHEKGKMLQEVVAETNLEKYVTESTFPTYEQLVDDFWRYSA